MTIAYPHIADQLFGRALAIEPLALRAIIEGPIGQRVLAGERIEILGKKARKEDRKQRHARARVFAAVEAEPVRSQDGAIDYALTRDGVAVISMSGALAKRFDWLAAACGFATYEGIGSTLDAVLSDYRVRAVMFDVDSPGGQVDGMLDLADQILAARAQKPVWAVANSRAASAAYALAGSAEKLFLPRLGLVGSIGAVTMHLDTSAADQASGLKYTAIYSGARKIDGWEHAALSAEAKAAMQKRIDHCRDALAELVGRQGRMSAKDALATEAGVFSDDEAVAAHLADGVRTFDAALAELTETITKPSSSRSAANAAQPGASDMSTQKKQMLDGSSPTAVVAAQQSQPAASAAAAAETPPASASEQAPPQAAAAAPSKPAPGETCSTCGTVMPDDEDAKKAKAQAAQAAGAYTVDMAMETMELCAIGKVPVADAKAFVAAKTPIADVRAALAKRSADAANATSVDGTAKPAGKVEGEVAAAWDQVVGEINAKLAAAPKR